MEKWKKVWNTSSAAVFKGTYRHRIDAEGPAAGARRPSAGRSAASAAVVVTLLDQCLAVYSPAEWARLEAQLAALPAFSKPVKALTRLLASRAADCEIDVQGRILLPPALRAAAGPRPRRGRGRRPQPVRGLGARDLGRLRPGVGAAARRRLPRHPVAPPPGDPHRAGSPPPSTPSGAGDPQAKPNG